VLLAAGPGTPEVLSELTGYDGFAARFPLRRVPGLLVTTPDLGARRLARHVVYFGGPPEFHLLPDFGGGLKLGADDTDGMIAEDGALECQRAAARILLDRAAERLPGFAGAALLDDCRLAIGVRPYPADGVSLAGPLPGAAGLYVIATHSGITLAPALGRLIAETISTGRTPEALAPFRLERIEGLSG
jgi:glycine/D-amino acid oxidase-like deaminating enzyme